MILDFANARRAFLMSRVLGSSYRFFLHSGRKTYLDENPRELKFVNNYCPEILPNKVDDIRGLNPKYILTTSASMMFKEYDRRIFNFLNSSRGKLIFVDYAWDAARHLRKKFKNGLRKNFHALAIAATTDLKVKNFAFSQPELDMFAVAPKMVNKNEVLKKYRIPSASKYVLVTSSNKYDSMRDFISFLRKLNCHVIWKLKYKQREYTKTVKKILYGSGLSHTLIAGPKEKSHTDFFSPICEFSTFIEAHIGLPSLSFTHAEMTRACVPNYMYSNGKIAMPSKAIQMAKHIWSDDSIKLYSKSFMLNRSKCKPKVDELFMTKNLCEKLI